jgi:SAM-dependent methyltransferase
VAWQRDPNGLVGPETLLGEVLHEVAGDEVSVLDVGAGPMTPLGHVYAGRTIRITPIDPLAEAYAQLLAEFGIEPPVPTVPGIGETLRDQFADGSFDVAIATNTLEHSYDPVAALDNMLHVVRPGGLVLLDHHRNEAENRLYRGLHQWNFDERDGRLVLWNPDDVFDLSEVFSDRAAWRVYRRGDRVRAILARPAE